MFKFLSTDRLARNSARHPWITLAVWVVILAGSIVAASGIGDVLTQDDDLTVTTESMRANQLIEERLRGETPPEEYIVVESATLTANDAAFAEFVDALVTDLRSLDGVASAASYLDDIPGLVSSDGQAALVPVMLIGNRGQTNIAEIIEHTEPLILVVDEANAADDFRVTTVGNGSMMIEMETLAEETMMKGELIGISLALLILLFVFGAAVAAGLPVVLALVSIIVAVGSTALVGRVFDLSFFVVNIITMIGLAVGIDYTLFIVQRFREERDAGREKLDAITVAGATASRAVFFSGVAVMIALSGMLIMPVSVFKSFGVGAILVVIASVVAALTLLPAVLSLLGDRVNALSIPLIGRRRSPQGGGGFWGWMTRAVTVRPVLSVLVTSGLLLFAASFYLTINLGSTGITGMPETSDVRHAFEVADAQFSSGVVSAEIVVDAPDVGTPAVQSGIDTLTASLVADNAFGAPVLERNPAGDLAVLTVPMKGDYSSTEARGALQRLRGTYIPDAFDGTSAAAYVNGQTAETVDSIEIANEYTPIVFGFILTASFALLMVVFRSIVVPLKAVAMNLLSVGAAYGLLVLVFQKGVGADLLGFQQTEVIEFFLPMFLFTILFGLSMDYHVFLLSRIKERYDETGDNSAAVAYGLRATGSIITGAALIMVAVFGGFALGDMVMMQQMGFGLAVAVILDATVVRSILVPASMELLGDWNWYFPNWLAWLPRIEIEGHPTASPVPQPAPVYVESPDAAAGGGA